MSKSSVRVAEKDFHPHLLGILREPPSPMPRMLLGLLLLLLCLLVVWAFWGRLDIVARAEGKLIPQTRLKVVQPLEGGRVSEILVKEGERVTAGQPLILMDANLARSDTRKLEQELALAMLHRRRVQAELDGGALLALETDDRALFEQVHERFFANRVALTNARREQEAALEQSRAELEAALQVQHKLREVLPIYRAGEQAYETLAKSGNGAQMELMERRRIRIEAEQDLQAQNHRIKALKAEIERAETKLEAIDASYRQNLLKERGDYSRTIAQLEQDLDKQRYRNALLELKAPENGVVQDLAVSTEGSVVPSGTVLLSLVPNNEPLKAEVFVQNKDIGFIAPGQTAKIKLAAYSFQRYGMVDAEVEHISPDSLTNQDNNGEAAARSAQRVGYKAILRLKQQQLQNQGMSFDLRSGMQVSAEINTGSRSVVEYLLSPVQKTLSEAAHER